MAYNTNTGKITAPVGLSDLMAMVPVLLRRTVGGVVQTVNSNDVGVLCGALTGDTVPAMDGSGSWTVLSRVNINKWAKYKPVIWPNVDTVTSGQWNPTTGKWTSGATWWKAGGGCGMTIPQSTIFGTDITNQNSFIYKLTHSLLGWPYARPTGGAQAPYRLTDFAHYYRDAIAPYGEIGATEVYINTQGEANLSWEVIDVDEDNLSLTDFAISNPQGGTPYQLTDFYLGVILYKANYSVWHVWTSDNKFGGGALDITLTNATSLAGDWKLMPFFSLNKTSGSDTFDEGLFVPMADTTPIDITLTLDGSNYIDVPEGQWNQAGSSLAYSIDLVNETSSAHVYSSIVITIHGGSQTGPLLGTKTVQNITVNARSTNVQTGTITATKSGYSSYWIVVADGTSGSTIRSKYNQIEDADEPLQP